MTPDDELEGFVIDHTIEDEDEEDEDARYTITFSTKKNLTRMRSRLTELCSWMQLIG